MNAHGSMWMMVACGWLGGGWLEATQERTWWHVDGNPRSHTARQPTNAHGSPGMATQDRTRSLRAVLVSTGGVHWDMTSEYDVSHNLHATTGSRAVYDCPRSNCSPTDVVLHVR